MKVYYLLSKYATRVKRSLSETSFNKKIRFLKEEEEEEYKKEFYKNQREEAQELDRVTNMILTKLRMMEQDYILSLNYHSEKPDFKAKLIKIQESISEELFGNVDQNKIPDELTKEVATKIRDFAKETTNQIIMDASQKIKDPNLLQERIKYEVARLDDIIYVKFGFKNKDVIKAFEKYELLSKKALSQSGVPMAQIQSLSSVPAPVNNLQ